MGEDIFTNDIQTIVIFTLFGGTSIYVGIWLFFYARYQRFEDYKQKQQQNHENK